MTTAPVMTITEELLAELEQKAKAATPGPWNVNPLDVEYENNSIYASTLSNGTRRLVATASTGSAAPGNREHIAAANPATLLALITHIRSLEARLEEAEKDAARYQWLRGNGAFAPSAWGNGWALACGSSRYSSVELDASVDAAIAQEGQSHE